MTRSNRRPLSRGEKNLVIGVPILLFLAVGSTFILARANSKAAIQFPPPVPLPKPNGYDLYVAAANAITPANPAVDAVDDRQSLLQTNPTLAAQRYSLKRKEAWLKANAAGFALFQQAQALPCRLPPYMPPLGNTKFGKLRQLARDKRIEANTYKLRGNWDAYTTASLDIVQLGTDLSHGAYLIGKLVGDAIEATGTASINIADNPISKLNAVQARTATRRLEALLKRRQSYAETLEIERWVTLDEFDWVRRSPNWRKGLLGLQTYSLKDKMKGYLIPESQIVAAIHRNFDERIADAKLPFSSPKQIRSWKDNPLMDVLLSETSYRRQEGRSLVLLQILLLRLALRTHHAENGHFPAKLDDLAPRYLASVPRDYYADNKPFHYVNQGETYLLYSVGPDGKDDKGTPIPWRNGKTGVLNGVLPSLNLNSQGDYVAGANR